MRADHLPDGSIRPCVFIFMDEREEPVTCRIDAIRDVWEAPSLKASGQGMWYICRVGEREYHLFHDDLFWFVEL